MRGALTLAAGMLLAAATLADADEPTAGWERVEVDDGAARFFAVAADPGNPQRIVAAGARSLYESLDGGASWRERFRLPPGTTVSGIAVRGAPPSATLVATDRGLYGSFDGETSWSRVFRGGWLGDTLCAAVAFHPHQRDTALLATARGLFISADRGRHWNAVEIPAVAREVIRFAFDPDDADRVYLVSSGGLFIGGLAGGRWERRLSAPPSTDAEPDAGTSEAADPLQEEPEPTALGNRLSAVILSAQTPPILYLAGTRGVQLSRNGGLAWERVTRLGLDGSGVSQLVLARRPNASSVLYAATERGVARYEPAQGRWSTLTEGWTAARVFDLAVTARGLWAATDAGLYRAPAAPDPFSDAELPSAHELLSNFVYEPTIAEVRDATIRYAEVHPNKITRWRRQAALKALLPTVDMDLKRSRSRDASIDEGTFPKFQVVETEDRDGGLNMSVRWDLGSLIWNDDQTAIDVRSKLMVQLRTDLVDEVTRTFFERRRIQTQLLTNPPRTPQEQLEKELRLQELTALLDGFTGGFFSKQVAVNEKQ